MVGAEWVPGELGSPSAGGGGGGTGLARRGGALLSSAKMPPAPRGPTLGKFPPARKARVGSAPPAARARGGGDRSQSRFRGAGGGCRARATWAQRWAFSAACGGADAPRTGKQPGGCFQLSRSLFFGVFSDPDTPLLAAKHTQTEWGALHN